MSSPRASTPGDWIRAVVVGVLAVALRAVAEPLLGERFPFIVAYPAMVLSSLLWGTGPGLISALICAAAVMAPQLPPEIARTGQPIAIGSFLLTGIVLALLFGHPRPTWRPRAVALAAGDTPLTAWLRAVLWGAFLIPLTAFLIAAWWGFERAREEAEAAATHACDLAYRQAQRTFRLVDDIAARAEAASAGADDPRNEAAVHQRLADMAAGLPSVVNLSVWDASGRSLARSDFYPVDRLPSVADRAYFQELRGRRVGEPNALRISEVIIGRQTGREIVNASISRASTDGSFRGVVAVSVSPNWFRDYYRSLTSEDPNLATFSLVRTDGTILARQPRTTDGRSQVSRGSVVLRRIVAGEKSGSAILLGDGSTKTRLVAFRRLDGYPLYVAAGFDREAMFAGWARFVGLLAAMLIPTTALLVYVSWVALRKTRREQATFDELQEQIRRRANAEKGMLESQKLETLAVVTGGVAHDFNNLLAIVNASLHVLKRRHPDVAQEKQVIAMSRAIQSGVRLTRQLLSFSRKQALRPETVHLQTWLPASEGLILSTLGPDIRWISAVEPMTLPVRVDLGELELALINLVVNSRHSMPSGGSLEVHVGNATLTPPPVAPHGVDVGGPMICLSVRDTGVGIPTALLSKVLEPFFTTRDKGAGSGLGLSQVQGFCVQAGGFVRIESVVGAGTQVSMYLPAAVAEPMPQDRETAVDHADAAQPMQGRVLLVEDNEAVASTTEMMLVTAGLTVVRAATADEALEHLRCAQVQPDAVLSDIAMPGSMNGIALAFELRRSRPQLPVLLTTGYAEQVEEATAGGLQVLPKPMVPEEILAELRKVLPVTVP